jgi:hypothetical protein
MANTIITSTEVLREAQRLLHQKLTFVGSIDRQYDDRFKIGGSPNGGSILIKKPNKYVVRSGVTLSVQDTAEESQTLQTSTRKGVDLHFTTNDLSMHINDFSKNYLRPAMSVLAANIEADALNMVKDVYNAVDNDGATLTFAKLMAARGVLQNNLAPMGDRTALLNTDDNVAVVGELKGLFNEQKEIAKQNREGTIGMLAGFDFSESSLLSSQLTGTAAKTTTYLVQGAQTTNGDSTLTVDTGTTTFKAGDVITVAGCYRVHPESKATTGVLQNFVVTADYAGGAGAIDVSPAIYTSGGKQNVVAAGWADNAAIVKVGAGASEYYYPSVVYHKEAFAFATQPLVMPDGVDFARQEVFDGISMRLIRQYTISDDEFPCRIDVQYGYKTLYPELACRIFSN